MTSKIRRMAAEFQGQFNEAMREAELDDVKKQLQGMNDFVSSIHKGGLNPIQAIRDELKGAIEAPAASHDKPATEIAGEAAAQARGEAHPVAPMEPPVVLPGSSVRRSSIRSNPFTSTLNHEADVHRTEALAEELRPVPVTFLLRAHRAKPCGARSSSQTGFQSRMTDPIVEEDEVESSRAPLIQHLTELRARLIKALIAFVLMFFVCFAGAKVIYNILVWPYVNAVGSPKGRISFTRTGSNISSRRSRWRRSGRDFWPSRSLPGRSTSSWPRVSTRTSGGLSCPIWWQPRFSSRSALRGLFHRHAASDAVLGGHAADRHRYQPPRSSSCPRSANTCR